MKKRISAKYIEKVPAERIAERMQFLVELGTKFEDCLPQYMQISYCPIRLLNTVVSYYYDKERHIDFHGSDAPNNFKKAAFLCRWIAKIKPFSIEVKNDSNNINIKDKFFYSNLINAMYCLLLFRVLTEKKPSETFDATALMYELHYGQPSANSLMIIFDRPKNTELLQVVKN